MTVTPITIANKLNKSDSNTHYYCKQICSQALKIFCRMYCNSFLSHRFFFYFFVFTFNVLRYRSLYIFVCVCLFMCVCVRVPVCVCLTAFLYPAIYYLAASAAMWENRRSRKGDPAMCVPHRVARVKRRRRPRWSNESDRRPCRRLQETCPTISEFFRCPSRPQQNIAAAYAIHFFYERSNWRHAIGTLSTQIYRV